MKFNVGSKQLQTQLQAVNKVINSKNALSILDNFLLRVEGSMLTITGSDQENVMTTTLEVTDADADGSIAVPAKRLLDILKEVPGQGLTFYINDETKEIDIQYLGGHSNFMGADSAEYPVQNAIEDTVSQFLLPAEVVLKGLESTLFAASTDTIRPVLTGIYWDIVPESVTFVSSDTHKLVRYVNTRTLPGIEAAFIMPAKPASILRSIIGKEEGDITIKIGDKSASFTFGNYTLSCRFINGRYPNYKKVIPEHNPYTLTIDRVAFLSAMRRVSLSASMASNLVRLTLDTNELLLRAQDMDYSTKGEERLQCEYVGNNMTIGFNAQYLIELLNNIQGDTIIMRLADPARAGVAEPLVQQENENIIVLLMPIQVLD